MTERLFGQAVPDHITCPRCGSTDVDETAMIPNSGCWFCYSCNSYWTFWQQNIIKKLGYDIRRMEQTISDYGWRVNPDRMGS